MTALKEVIGCTVAIGGTLILMLDDLQQTYLFYLPFVCDNSPQNLLSPKQSSLFLFIGLLVWCDDLIKTPLRIFPECHPDLTPTQLGWVPATPFDPECERMDGWMRSAFPYFFAEGDKRQNYWHPKPVRMNKELFSAEYYFFGGAVMHEKLSTLLPLCFSCSSFLFFQALPAP